MTDEFAIIVETDKNPEKAAVDVLAAVEQKGWSVIAVIDLSERLAAKGFQKPPVKVIEVCAAKHANAVLGADARASLCMPCRINVLGGEKTRIAAMDPALMSRFFPDAPKDTLAEVGRDIREIMENAR